MREWKSELSADLKNFKKQSDQVMVWDNQLRANYSTHTEITDLLEHILLNSEDLNQMCSNIEDYQTDLGE